MLLDVSHHFNIVNPKQRRSEMVGRARWFPYYAGYSTAFAVQLLKSSAHIRKQLVVDPWNGSGATTDAAASLGCAAVGIDLNPVMTVTAKARLVGSTNASSLEPICEELISLSSRLTDGRDTADPEPLKIWLSPKSSRQFRCLETAVQELLLPYNARGARWPLGNCKEVSSLAAFYYVALFMTLRSLIVPFVGSNRTWVRQPRSASNRVRPNALTIYERFRRSVRFLAQALCEDPHPIDTCNADEIDLRTDASTNIALPDGSADLVVTSPPYCTRIDYAVATLPELAVVGIGTGENYRKLRNDLIGSTTVPSEVPKEDPKWGRTCLRFLEQMSAHPSKASSGYYYKNHVTYFRAMYRSLHEIVRITKSSGYCVLVVQDSYYKDIHNDLPQILSEMIESHGKRVVDRRTFIARNTMAQINPATRRYRARVPGATESVLIVA